MKSVHSREEGGDFFFFGRGSHVRQQQKENKKQFKIINANAMSTAKYPASRAFLSGKFFSMYEVVRVSGISRS